MVLMLVFLMWLGCGGIAFAFPDGQTFLGQEALFGFPPLPHPLSPQTVSSHPFWSG
jgi:hypothetical protein